jgi:Concanavalin A-like lectin/glucanases superfamily
MKDPNINQSSIRKPVPPRVHRIKLPFPRLAPLAIIAGLLLCGGAAQAQPVLKLRFGFDDAGPGTTTPSDTSGGGVSATLQMLSGAGAATDYHGPANSGVAGAITGSRALNFTSNTRSGANGPVAATTNASLGFGTVSSLTLTMWWKKLDAWQSDNFGPRLFVMGAPGFNDANSANSIGMKYQAANQLQFDMNAGNPTAAATFPSDLPTNKWIFIAITYDGTNLKIYEGTDTAATTLISTTAAAGTNIAFGSTGAICIGNRRDRGRSLDGWIDDFRFYTGAGDAAFVENLRSTAAGNPPVISNVYPDGLKLQEGTNKLAFTVNSPASYTITNVQVVLNGADVSSSLVIVTNSASSNSVTYSGLQLDKIYSASISAWDANGSLGTFNANFDTFNATNFVWEAEEFDHDGGYGTNTDYTSYATNTSFFGLDSVEGVDTHKGSSAGSSGGDYRAGSGDGTRTQTPPVPDTQRQKFLDLVAAGDANVVDHYVGFWSSGEWQNYTRTFPAGKYNVYGRLSCGVSATMTLAQVTSGQGTSTQTTTNLGTFSLTGTSYAIYQWIPLRDGLGNLATVSLGGSNTVRVTSGGGGNANFYMLVPPNTNLPSISGVYPNGQVLFQSTNKFVFTASSGVTTISTNSITLTLNGTNVTPSLVFAGSPTSWNVSYTGLLPNQTYTAVISVTDANGSTVSSTLKFDTWNPVFQFEAEDFDFSGGQYIDNPVPTTGPAANSYFGQVGTMNVDEFNNGALPPYAGASPDNYRNTDPIATTLLTAAEAKRQQFIDAGAPDYNVGFLGPFFWENYTKTWPTGTFNIYGRFASGANIGSIHMAFDQVTAGWGTTAQGIKHVGVFTIPTTGGYSSYFYAPLLDEFGNYANVTLGGTNTFRTTFAESFGTRLPGEFGLNINFYMLVAPRTDLARIDGVYPDGSAHFQATNRLSFTASSPHGINTTNIQVTLNGVNIWSNLVFSGSSTSWNVSYPDLAPNSTYTAVLRVTDNNGVVATTTVTFDTFNPANFTWQAEDYDFSSGQYIDNPTPTAAPAVGSYFGQVGTVSVDYDYMQTVAGETFLYRSADFIGTELSADSLLPGYVAAQQADGAVNYDVAWWQTNAWMNYTRTFPTGNFIVYGRLAGVTAGLPYTNALYEVTSGWGTATQTTNLLGTFQSVGAGPQTWQWVRLSDNNGQPVVVALSGTNTLRVTTLSGNANADFFMLVTAPSPVSLTASLSGSNIILSFPTQAGLSYTVQYKDDLTAGVWTPLPQGTAIWGDGSVKSVSDGPIGAKRFYRLVIPIP